MMTKKRLLWQIYPAFLFIVLLSIIPVTWYADHSMRRFFLHQTSRDLEARARLVEDRILPLLDPLNREVINEVCKRMGKQADTRITVIGPEGTVYGDSDHDPLTMDNHIDRPEVRAALRQGKGESIRYSRTLQRKLMYEGIAIRKGGRIGAVIRTSIPVDLVDAVLRTIQIRIALAGFFIVLISAALSYLISRRISRPFEEIQKLAEAYSRGYFETRIPAFNGKEIERIAKAMKGMADEMRDRIETITRQRNELNAVLSSMIEGVIAVDLDGKVLSINGTAGRLFQIDPVRSTGRTIEELSRNPRLTGFVARALDEGDAFEEDMAVRVGTEDRILNVRSTSLQDSEGGHIGTLLVIADVTHIRELENMRRDFVANVSHEIKTPITAVKGFVETLLDGALENPGDARRFLGIIEKHTRRLEAIVEDLLSLSRIEQEGELAKMVFAEFGLKRVLESAIQLCKAKAEPKGIKISLDCPDELRANGNARLLEQAVVNLLDNAVQYSPRESSILVHAGNVDGGTKISVRDQGCGIAAEHIQRIFERFYRVDKGRSRSIGGTGLGLAIVKHIVQAHGGKITLDSAPGKGSTFTIHLDLKPRIRG
jgi:two-component system, OmpR family, phosphate regulon sensor histidine kinase PhoR